MLPCVFSPRNHSDRRPSGAMATGAGAHAEGLPCPGPGGHCCPEGDLPSETAEAWTGPAGVPAAARCVGAQTGLSDQLWVVSELLTSDFLSCGPSRTVKAWLLCPWIGHWDVVPCHSPRLSSLSPKQCLPSTCLVKAGCYEALLCVAQSLESTCRFSAWASINVKKCGGWLSVKKLTYMVFSLIHLFKIQKHGKKVHLGSYSQALLYFYIPGSWVTVWWSWGSVLCHVPSHHWWVASLCVKNSSLCTVFFVTQEASMPMLLQDLVQKCL